MSPNPSNIRLYTDEDVDGRLATVLARRGFEVSSCFQAGNAGYGHPDEWQLSFAVGEQRAILTHNIGDYSALAKQWASEDRAHFGILFVHQVEISHLIFRTADFLMNVEASEIYNATLWLP